MVNKRLINTGEAAAAFDPLQNFETVTYTGNGGTQKITGYIRKGAAFNGSSSYISLPNADSILGNPAGQSISVWANFNSITTSGFNSTALLASNNGVGAADWQITLYDGKIYADYFDGLGAYRQIVGSTVLSANTWYHFLVVFDSTNTDIIQCYVNGSAETMSTIGTPAGTFSGNINNSSIPITIGRRDLSGSGWYMNGKIDQVRIFDKALSSAEVTTLYNETYDSSTKSTTDIFGDGSGVALYELDDSAVDTGVAIDSGQSAVFNGSSSKIDLPVLGLGGSSTRSVSAWIKTTNNSTTQFIFGSGTQASYQVFAIHLSPTGKVSVSYSASQLDTTSSPINNNQWHHIVAIFSGGSTANTTLYVDGVSQTLTEIGTTGTVNTGNQNYAIGYNSPNPSFPFYFNGQIDDVRIYSDVLTSTEVGYLYNNTTASIPTDNFVSYYKLDGNANDTQGSNNGTWGGTESYSTPALLTQYNGTATNVNFLGMAFQPDLVWTKERNIDRSHDIYDSVRGAGKKIASDSTAAEVTETTSLTSFDSNGFTLGSGSNVNHSGRTYVAWCWKAGGASVSNTDGTITSTVSANQDAGFSIVKYTGVASATSVGHGLSSAPEMVIIKRLTTSGSNWIVYHKDLGNSNEVRLNTTDASTATGNFNNTSPDSQVVYLGSGSSVSDPSLDYIAYCFHSVDGYQKVGSYTGNGSADGPTITTGFKPRWIMVKATSDAGSWVIMDAVRDAGRGDGWYTRLVAESSAAEVDDYSSDKRYQISDTGFQVTNASNSWNGNGRSYIYLAIA